jgi:plastocyanin
VAAVVEMTSLFSFEPHTVVVRSGQVVEWRNKSTFTHSVTDAPAKNQKLSGLPAGAEPFDSGSIPSGEIYRRTFTTPGTYRYYCDPHESFGMLGVVVVEPAS